MTKTQDFLNDFHWLMDVLQDIDVGLVILDKEFKVQLWNSFMQNHSAKMPDVVLGQRLFDLFPELPEAWFRRKADSVFVLQNSAFTTWEQRPYLFRFNSYRPITSIADYMYQNCTIIPLTNARGEVEHICLIIYDVTEVAVNRLQLQTANEKLHTLSRTDGLTGLLNRKSWQQELEQEHRRFKRHGHVSSMVMFDIDHFKKVNDTYGHPTGDQVIRETSSTLRNSLRDIDLAGRYGGEEFAIILKDTGADGAMTLSERLRKSIESIVVEHEGHNVRFTVSLGIAELNSSVKTPADWIECADKALYKAKNGGRNCSVIYTQ
ncbi:sensor domain-containing diguanylate cyclase [Teredinibacter haidensis]|uniref:sensor domain-containing diguanylate cyclase n=1 Tax=Teredinibacter haidensis TaxID=2731755 RepID=UPI000948D3F6|nr:sensor domain-containing diguanylate cyclase [Teredinibacter haidensis]